MNSYLEKTNLLDYENQSIKHLIAQKGWAKQTGYDKIGCAYNYVRDEIRFGYNVDDAIPASRVLADGYGQCNTKGILLMALLRALGIPCKLHGFTIDKRLQKGAMQGFYYRFSPDEIIHTWVDVWFAGRWLELEGFILDQVYLAQVQKKFQPDANGGFCGWGVAVEDFNAPPVDWNGESTYIQSKGIVKDFGLFDDPDTFFALHSQTLCPCKRLLYRHVIRRLMNRNIRKMRSFAVL